MSYYQGIVEGGRPITPGIKIWSNGIPIKGDTYKSCEITCSYCFARTASAAIQERAGVRYNPRIARPINVSEVARHFEKAFNGAPGFTYWALRNRYYIELGTLGEIFQPVDLQTRVTYNFMRLTGSYKIPLFINSKCSLLVDNDRYFNLLANYPAPVIMSMTIIGIDDKLVKKREPKAPLASQRIELIRRLKDVGIPTVVYIAPYMKGVSDVRTDEFIHALIEAGAVGAHLRNFYLTGKVGGLRIWKKYAKDYNMGRHGSAIAWDGDVMEDAYLRMQEIADKYDPNFRIVGLKSRWFGLNDHHGKLEMDSMEQKYQDGIIDFTAIPILRKIRERLDEPQLLSWHSIGYKRDKIEYPRKVYTSGGWGDESVYLGSGCRGNILAESFTSGRTALGDGWDWMVDSLWGGEGAFMSTVQRIHSVEGTGNDRLYAYLPPAYNECLVDGNVPYDVAKDFHAPARAGGTEDKFYVRL